MGGRADPRSAGAGRRPDELTSAGRVDGEGGLLRDQRTACGVRRRSPHAAGTPAERRRTRPRPRLPRADHRPEPPRRTPNQMGAPTGGHLMKARLVLAGAGVALGLWGLRLLFGALEPAALVRLPIWLGGAVLADDFFLVPLTIAVGWLVTRWSAGPDRHRTIGAVRTTFLYVGISSLIAVPLLLRQGTGANPTVLPRDYLRDWLLLEATIVAAGVVWFVVQRSRFTFRRSRASSGDIGGR